MEKQFKGVGLLFAVTAFSLSAVSAQNLLTNGDFEQGNTGFSTDYSYSHGNIWWQGQFDINQSPANCHIGGADFRDHTSGTGQMIILNGSSDSSMRLWSETIKVEPNRTYAFSGWSATWGHYADTTYDPNPPKLLISINGVQQGGPIQIPAENGQWTNFKVLWNSQGATQAVINLGNYNTGYEGNDLALDDLSLTKAASSPFMTNGLVAYYPFDGNANDAAGTNNGTAVGATLATDRFGQPNTAYKFNGTGAHISFAAVPLNQMDHWTISAWMKPSKLIQIGDVVNMGYNDVSPYTANGVAFGMSCVNSYTWDTAGSNFTATVGGVDWIASGYSFASTNKWYHLTMTREAGIIKFYVNGVQTASTSHSVPRLPTDFTIGAANYTNGFRSFDGLIDDVRIYNTSLSGSDVQSLYSYETAQTVPAFTTNGLVAYYPFDGNANDVAGTNNGTAVRAMPATDRFGQPNSAYSFDGTGACLNFAASPLNQMDHWTISTWMKPSKLVQLGNIVTLGYTDQYPSAANGVAIVQSFVNPYTWETPGSDFTATTSGIDWIASGYSMTTTNAWYHLIMTREAGVIKFYVNGVQTAYTSPSVPRLPTDFTIGAANFPNGERSFTGLIDEVRIYNRALPLSEVQGLYAYEAPPTPIITTQPTSVLVNAHGNASFKVTASGPQPLSYQWTLNGTNIPGATSNSFTLTNVVQTNLGNYAVTVKNAYGSVTSSNALLAMRPFIQSSFAGQIGYWGKDATLSVQVWGTGPMTYQWYKNGVAVPNATNAVLNLKNLQFTNGGAYSLVARNPYGSVTNTASQLVINPAGVTLGMYPGVVVSGVVGYTYSIQSTTDLNNTNSWVTAATITLMQPEQLWIDVKNNASSPTNQIRFYRVIAGQ